MNSAREGNAHTDELAQPRMTAEAVNDAQICLEESENADQTQPAIPGVTGARIDRSLSQFFTPQPLANRVAAWACANEKPEWVLEPSAGRGALIKGLDLVCETNVSAVEIDRENCDALVRTVLPNTGLTLYRGDFFKCSFELDDGEVKRMAILSSRPQFGGEHSAKTDFLALELVRRAAPRRQCEATPARVEWWS